MPEATVTPCWVWVCQHQRISAILHCQKLTPVHGCPQKSCNFIHRKSYFSIYNEWLSRTKNQNLKQEFVLLISCTRVLVSKSCKTFLIYDIKTFLRIETIKKDALAIQLQFKAMELNSFYIRLTVCVYVCVLWNRLWWGSKAVPYQMFMHVFFLS